MGVEGDGLKGAAAGTSGANVLQEVKVRIMASLGLVTGGAIAALLYLGFLATRFAWYTNLAVLLCILIAVPAALVALWIQWGMSFGGRFARRFRHDDW
ncbi:MAG: PrgI family protein [Thermoplasmata archaeon]|nr:PrgI family protein [Thermoplasmata archaeon]